MKASGFAIAVLCIFSAFRAWSCTIFCATNREAVLVGNNEDGPSSFPSKLWFVPPGKFGHGRVCFGWYSQAQGGMNDRGLFIDWAALPDPVAPPKKSNKPPPDGCMAERALATCGSVEDALRLFDGIDYRGNSAHFLVVDATGNSAIGEWVDGELKPIRKRGKQIITNFLLADPKSGNYPCQRFETVTKLLATPRTVSPDLFAAILKNTAAKWEGGGTKYSNVYDLTRRRVTVYSEGDFGHGITIDLDRDVRGGLREVDLKTLCAQGRKQLQPRQPSRKNIKIPSAEAILNRFVEARGGKAAIQSVRSYRIKGQIREAWGDTGEFEIVAAPGMRSEMFAFKKIGTYRNGFDGKTGWQDDSVNGPRVIAGPLLEHARRDAEFFNWRYDGEYTTRSVTVESFEGVDCFALRLTTRGGLEAVHYFDVESGLLKGIVGTTALRSGTTWSRLIYGDYKKTEGLLFPMRLRLNDEGYDITAEATVVTVNEDILFALPPGLHASQSN